MNQEDYILIRKTKKGDQKAISSLYEKHKSYWFQICLRYAKNRDEAQDLFQDGVAKIFEKMNNYNEKKGSFNGWSNKVLVHEALRSLKKNQWQDSFKDASEYDSLDYENENAIERITAKELT